ncbi:hypothetical protein ACIQAA_05895 [Neobacillus sp. NPDC093182]|uniref:hypothetical protein n=1 Tax=Neobacillus sp. NPDC093182 TaxID=3364297 RepID=UPI00381F84C9
MYFQRAGVAGSPVIHLIPTSSLSIELNSPTLLGSIRCSYRAPVTKRSGYDSFTASKGSIREDAVKPGGTEKWKAISPRNILLLSL